MHGGSGAGEPVRVVVVEDDAAVRDGVASALAAQGYEVEPLADADRFDDVVAALRPDLLLLDVTLPGDVDGFVLASRVRRHSDVPIVFLTAADAVEDRIRGFELGCDDYLVKPFSLRELLVRIRAILRRAGARPSVLAAGDLAIDPAARTATRAGVELALTPTEFDLLLLLARSPGTVIPKQELFRQVWGFDEPGGHTVEVHISALRRKLERHGPRVVVTARGGYALRPA